ncbi:MAG: hypothetical protein ACLP0J_09280 [Solirubrobacteraceae bacterium]
MPTARHILAPPGRACQFGVRPNTPPTPSATLNRIDVAELQEAPEQLDGAAARMNYRLLGAIEPAGTAAMTPRAS